MQIIADKLHDPHSSSGCGAHGIFLFPNTDAGSLATVRSSSMPRQAIGRACQCSGQHVMYTQCTTEPAQPMHVHILKFFGTQVSAGAAPTCCRLMHWPQNHL